MEKKIKELSHLAVSTRKNQDKIKAVVRDLRVDGVSWGEIGQALGVSRQAAWRKYRGDDFAPPD